EVAPNAHVLMLTVSEDEDDLAAALQAGAEGYLLKTINSEDLCESIVKVMNGDSVVSPEMTRKLVTAFRSRTPAPSTASQTAAETPPVRDTLSTREREILALIARGDSNKLIARELDIAETTVKIHVQHILRKLGLTSRVQAAVYAAGRGAT
ncbi:MAG TPA: LuxR C-terminal-related transcriptional regulator, partial [Ramlibacter sp.]|nr:LuxR C-terminal-related transcriptional regulator [Ramlibacter sp.]